MTNQNSLYIYLLINIRNMSDFIRIKKGHKSSGFNFPKLIRNVDVCYEISFNDSNILNPMSITDSYDYDKLPINTIFGIMLGFRLEYNSIRICWRTIDKDMIGVYSLVYMDGLRSVNLLCIIRINNSFSAKIKLLRDNMYEIVIRDKCSSIYVSNFINYKNKNNNIVFELKDCLGGTKSAPQEIKYLKRKSNGYE